MRLCYDEGTIRAYLDNALSAEEQHAVAVHLATCATCQDRVQAMRVQSEQVRALLEKPGVLPDPQRALSYIKHEIASGHSQIDRGYSAAMTGSENRRMDMQKSNQSWFRQYRALFAGIAAVVLVVGLLALPPVQALADQFLQVFRVQKVMFVPVSSERMEELDAIDLGESNLFLGEPEMLREPAPPREFDSVGAAEDAIGYAVAEPDMLPTTPISTEVVVQSEAAVQFQVDVETSRQVLELLDIQDVTIPDALGDKPITVELPETVMIAYHGEEYDMRLIQGNNPDVSLPEGVELAELSKAMLRVLGMDEQQAEALSREVDLSSTLVFPFPADLENISQVTIGDSQGLLIRAGGDDNDRYKQIYWHSGDHFYVLTSEGYMNNTTLVEAAQSVH